MNTEHMMNRNRVLESAYSREELMQAYSEMIISASGWRKIFSSTGDEQEKNREIPEGDIFLIAHIALTLAHYLKGTSRPVILARDARINGEAIASVILNLLSVSCDDIRYLGIASAPETFAYSADIPDSIFIYISASHNPIAHNGLKFGEKGGVFNKDQSMQLIALFAETIRNEGSIREIMEAASHVSPAKVAGILDAEPDSKKEALEAYYRLLLETHGIEDENSVLRRRIRENRIGIVGELNGSARGVSIDSRLFKSLSIQFLPFNATPGEVVHEIVPEGENLQLCRNLLETEHAKDPSVMLGYVPDNDGDRGNLVYYDEISKQVELLSAQELFALITSIELALSRRTHTKVALAVNGPTSLMIDHIAERFSVKLVRTEVGEAHVVQAGEMLREDGYRVPLVGEGSNGGIILYPSRVRDPMNTLLSLVKLLTDSELFHEVTHLHLKRPSLALAIRSLEKRTITGSFSSKAKLKIKSRNHGDLKDAYEDLFRQSFRKKEKELASRFGIFSYSEEQMEGTLCTPHSGSAHRHPPYTGGLKILLHDSEGNVTDFLWMRGSGTEPVFRIMVDALGDDAVRHDELLSWHHNLVLSADREAAKRSH